MCEFIKVYVVSKDFKIIFKFKKWFASDILWRTWYIHMIPSKDIL